MSDINTDHTAETSEEESGTVKFGVSLHRLPFGKLERLAKTLKTTRSGAIRMLVDTYAEPMARQMTKTKS